MNWHILAVNKSNKGSESPFNGCKEFGLPHFLRDVNETRVASGRYFD